MSWFGFLGSFLLLCLLFIPELASFQPRQSQSCSPQQTEALLQFRDSFTIKQDDLSFSCSHSQPKTASWKSTTSCCSWDGIMCDDLTGDVVGLDLSCSCLQGTIDSNSSLFALRHLRSLNLAGNDFVDSSILLNISAFAGMTHLNLSSSSFSGVLTDNITHLSNNHFYGEIPTNIVALISLKGLNFSHNHVTGTIPPIIRNLTVLEWLDLSSNELTSLAVLNLSHHKLTGRIPTGRQFNTFDAGSFQGNPELRGFPLAKVCVGEMSRPPLLPSSKHEANKGWNRNGQSRGSWTGTSNGSEKTIPRLILIC